MDSPKKTCSRAARENAKKKPEINSIKHAHTGLKFNFDRKKLVTHEFSFNSVSKTEKVTRYRSSGKSVEKKDTAVVSSTAVADSKDITVLMDTLKISKSEECSNREKSPLRKEMPKYPVVERLMTKKACTNCSRCSRASKGEEKPETKPIKAVKSKDQSPKTLKKETHCTKTVKIETPPSPKPAVPKNRCSKLAKLLAEPPEKTPKPKSILVHPEKSASRENCDASSKNCEKTPPSTEKPKSCSADKGKPNCSSEEKTEFWPKSGKSESVTFSADVDTSDKGKPAIPNGTTELPPATDTKACLLNGRHEEHLCDPHFRNESPDVTDGVEATKPASKIPRKMNAASGLKVESNHESLIQL